MKANNLIAEGLVGRILELSTLEVIVLQSRLDILNGRIAEQDKKESKFDVRLPYEMAKELSKVFTKILGEPLSLEAVEIDLFDKNNDTQEALNSK